MPKLGMAAATMRVPTTAAHRTKRPTGYHSRPSPPPFETGRASSERYPSHHAPKEITNTERKKTPEKAPIATAEEAAAISPAHWLQPSAAIRIGNGAR